jgi:hypothetical protein
MSKITKHGVYEISAEDYHADPCPEPSLSSSMAKVIYGRTAGHAWESHPRLNPAHEAEEAEKFDIGSASHALMLGDPKKFEVIDAADWRKNEAKAARDAARAAGRIPLLTEQWKRVNTMVAAGRAQLATHEDSADAFTNGKPEQTLIWQEDGIWCRARLDWLPDKGAVFHDYKSTEASASPDAWQRILFALGFDIQAAFYRRGIRALGLCENPEFKFVVQETESPFGLCVIGLMPGALDLADSKKVAEALRRWKWCLTNNRWPIYPTRTCYIDAPAWHESEVLAREVRDDDAAKAAGVKHIFDLAGIDRHGDIVP